MDNREMISQRFKNVEGGLFSKVTKADVGDSFAAMGGKVTLMGWADPFYPDPAIPQNILDTVIEAYKSGFPAHYTQPTGSLELRREIAKKLKSFNHLDADPSRNIIITPGSDSGLFFAMSAFLDQGDEVLVPDPSYPNNFLNPRLLGAITVPVMLDAEHNYRLDMEVFEAAVTEKTKMVVLTHPNNPTTTVFSREELEELASFIIKHNLILVVDQAFEDTVFDNREFVTPASLPGMWERTVTVFSISKGMALSGFRVGYLVACDTFMDVYYGAAVSVIGAAHTASQTGAVEAFRNPGFMDKYRQCYDRRRRYCVEAFGRVPKVKIEMPQSGFFCWVDVRELGDSTEIMEYIIREAGVAVNDGKNYGEQGNGYLRIIDGCLGSDEEAKNAIDRIAEALRKYPAK
ncbi:MAG: pyridoxal phosphate-dependent aminotransferase [Eubacteriales bacterium]|nr:pyridoxal phosphate-dependent aminotransferase [Eubacteriales bacterium]